MELPYITYGLVFEPFIHKYLFGMNKEIAKRIFVYLQEMAVLQMLSLSTSCAFLKLSSKVRRTLD